MTHSADLELALRLADVAAEISMSRYRASDLVIETKPDASPVTEADKAVERALRDILAQERPEDLIAGEEFGSEQAHAAGRRWIIDPIDGTKNYLRGVPVWANLIALAIDDDIVVGVAEAPAMGRRWWAERGCGAFTRDVNGEIRRINASRVQRLEDASFSYSDSIGWDHFGDRGPVALDYMLEHTWRARAYGDFLSHVLVAEGAVDIAAEPQLAPWDVAALVPILLEAGGQMTGFDGKPCLTSGSGVSSNGLLHQSFLELLN